MKRTIYEQLQPGMITGEDVYALNGQLLIPKGIVLTQATLDLLKMYSIRTIRIDDGVDERIEAILGSQQPPKDEGPFSGSDIPDFFSKLPEKTRQLRTEEILEYKKHYKESLDYFQVAINNLVAKNTDLDVSTILNQTVSLLNAGNRHASILEMIVYMKEYDNNIYAHSINVSLLCNMLAHWLEYSEQECQLATACGMFHDIGKLTIPEAIIQKPTPLTPQELQIARQHAQQGYYMLSDYHVDETVKLSALMHHERCDGSGYPNGLKGGQIDRFAKIVTICDIYNAMTSDRPYRKAFSPFSVIEHFETEGLRKFDTRSILLFMEKAANTYLNCPVRLSNGRSGYVVFINRSRLGRPTVQCGTDFIDLRREKDLYIAEMLPVL